MLAFWNLRIGNGAHGKDWLKPNYKSTSLSRTATNAEATRTRLNPEFHTPLNGYQIDWRTGKPWCTVKPSATRVGNAHDSHTKMTHNIIKGRPANTTKSWMMVCKVTGQIFLRLVQSAWSKKAGKSAGKSSVTIMCMTALQTFWSKMRMNVSKLSKLSTVLLQPYKIRRTQICHKDALGTIMAPMALVKPFYQNKMGNLSGCSTTMDTASRRFIVGLFRAGLHAFARSECSDT